MAAPETILKLVERFRDNLDSYKSPSYNETQARREFIDPFFKTLGWDVDNAMNFSEQFKEVVHEDAIKIGGATKAPDYSFRLGGRRIFFLEAKKPSVNLKDDPSPAFQLRRYAWTAKLPLSILTDFEEFIVYDTRIRPDIKDAPSKARILYFRYDEYADKWDEIAAIFSPDSIKKGAFERYATSSLKKKGTAEVDSALLSEIEGWREQLARNIALRNPGITERDLNYAVQMTIDRIIFLRICEDRGIETYGRLKEASSQADAYKGLCELFNSADDKYNSGLFHFATEKDREGLADTFTPKLTIDDKILKDILKSLYYPDSPYEFSVMPPEILGQVYENFLGSVIRLTAGGRAVIEQKTEVRKAGGVYYTPSYIVDYIVKNTLGKLLESKTPQEVAGLTESWRPSKNARPIAVLDPACGSGSFLLGAYKFLLNWHLEQYLAEPGKWLTGKTPRIYQNRKGAYCLTTSERKRILLANIYGVDIDQQAVEVTKLSLLLKVLEEENAETINKQLTLFHERALPDLGANIRCGNSLIGPDYYSLRQTDLFNTEESFRINAFDWTAEFPAIMSTGGFDAVIGNPPYVRQEGLSEFKDYFSRVYKTYTGTSDIYVPFIEKGVNLLREGGMFSYIVANKWMRANYGKPLREWLAGKCVEEIIDFGDLRVFQSSTTYPCIIRVSAKPANTEIRAVNVDTLDFEDLNTYAAANAFGVSKANLDPSGWSLVDNKKHELLSKIKKAGIPLGEYVGGQIYYGIKTGLNKALVIDAETKDRLIAEDPKSVELIKPFLAGRDIKRYATPKADKYLIFTRRGTDIEQYPAIMTHLLQFRNELTPKPSGFKGEWKGRKPGPYLWFEIQDTVTYYNEFEKSKIMWPEIAQSARFSFDSTGLYANNKVFIMPSNDLYLLGLLNSKLLRIFIHSVCTDLQGDSYNFSGIFLVRTPIRPINSDDPTDTTMHDRVVSLVTLMLDLNKKLAASTQPHERTIIERQIDATDKEIDTLVYKLYGLTDDEIIIVEGEK
jgi:predicted type IV restriction endonuclease